MKSLFRTVHRARSYAGQLGLLAALVGLAAFLASGPPRLANDRTDVGLRADINRLISGQRDLTFTTSTGSSFDLEPPADHSGRLDEIRRDLPPALGGVISDAWFVAEVGPADASVNNGITGECPQLAAIRRQTGTDEATRIVEGRRPASGDSPSGDSPSGDIAEVIAGRDEAKALGVRVGDTVTVLSRWENAKARVVGLYEALDPAAPFWADMLLTRVACPNPSDGTRFRVTLLTDTAGSLTAGGLTTEMHERWRYRIDEQRLTADRIGELTTAVATARRQPPDGTTLVSSVDTTLAEFDRRLRGVRALLAVIQAGLLATMAGLILLAARLAVDRRRAEYALIRARGGSVRTIGGRMLAETLLVVVPATAAGWLAGHLSAGRADAGEPFLVAGVALLAALAPAAYAAAGARHPDFTGHRRDLVADRPSPRRITAEAFLVLLAAGGTFLVRRRGLETGPAGVDPYLIAVPVLLALAASVVALRLVPFPLRWTGRLAARARGAVAFLGLTGAGRGAPLRSGPLAVLVIAIATGIFSSTVTTTVGHARDRAAELAVPADAVAAGFAFGSDTAQRIAAVDGVTGAAAFRLESAANLRSDASTLITQVQAMVVDTSTGLDLPAELTSARPGAQAVPALVSTRVAQRIGPRGTIDVQGRRYAFQVAAVSDTAPGFAAGVRDFLIVPLQALPVPATQPVVSNRVLVRGSGFDPAAVREAADAGQREYTKAVLGRAIEDWQLAMPATVTTRDGYRADLDERGVDGVLSFTFAAGIVACAVLALLAVALTVLAGAPARGRTLSRLRTLGLSARQGRRLLVFELVPLIGVAVLVGSLVGIALPTLIGPALGLDDFTAGMPAVISVDPLLAAGVLIVAALAVAGALVVEDAANRRLGLGTVLRLGEEQS
ncbi:FtsX-like permease family protein [Actinoplanes sp. GCM10030250]|uniref:FtsX-like permease family protein n=1 Tax=Actinoplanes sp. GCM10030250 TaxID=3273376 RepID=UPI003613940F